MCFIFCSINKNEFTEEEDSKLLELFGSIGENKWSLIAKEMQGRTDSQIRQRYLQLVSGNQKYLKRSESSMEPSTTLQDDEAFISSTIKFSCQSPTLKSRKDSHGSERKIHDIDSKEILVPKSEPILCNNQSQITDMNPSEYQEFYDYFMQPDSPASSISSAASAEEVKPAEQMKNEMILAQRANRVVGTGLTTLDKIPLLPHHIAFQSEEFLVGFPIVSFHEYEIPSQGSPTQGRWIV